MLQLTIDSVTVRGPPVSKQNQVAGDAERHRFLGAAVRPFFVAFFRGCEFTDLSTNPAHSVGHIFLCVKKDMEERHAKGLQSRPLESCFYTGVRRGDVRTFLRIRRNAINAI